MAEQIYKQSKDYETPDPVDPIDPAPAADYVQNFDDILDDIDDVLEENALSFVQGFVQKGGE